MASIGPISLFREKTSVHQISGGRPGLLQEGALLIRSNRIILELAATHRKEQVVIRGQTVPNTLRVAAMVVERFLRDPQLFHRDQAVDWDDLWGRRRSDYDRRFSPGSWVAIYVDGHTIFSTQGSEAMDLIEQKARGEDLTDDIIRTATRSMFKPDQDVVVQHESQTAVVFTPFSTHLRAAVLERRGGKTGSFSVSAFHSPENKIRLGAFVNFVADLVEGVTLREFLERMRTQMEESGQATPAISHDHLSAALGRKRQLMEFIAGFERSTKVQYRPERPEL